MDKTTVARLEQLARLDALDQLIDAISIPDTLTPDEMRGALLIAEQVLDAIKAEKKAIRTRLETMF